MELIENHNPKEIIQQRPVINEKSQGNFIEANTQDVSLKHLKNDCIIPVFSKDNESTISHYQFIEKASKILGKIFPNTRINSPDIRASHVIKGRVPSAIGKPAKELKEHEKTIYYERCGFMIEVPEITETINGNTLSLSIGGVRAYNQENLYSKKSVEKFKVFIGFKNWVCTNMCISTDGFSNEIRVSSIDELGKAMIDVFSNYNKDAHLNQMKHFPQMELSQKQFAHFIGKCRMYQHLNKMDKKGLFQLRFNDGQLNNIVKNYYQDPSFQSDNDGTINLWNLYNLFTEANKSSYIDSNLERNVNAHELIQNIGFSMEKGEPNWFLSN